MSGLLGYFMGFMPTKPSADAVYETSLLDSGTRQDRDDVDIHDNEVTYSELPLDYKRWKKERNANLMKFFEKRFYPPNSDEEDEEESSSSESDTEMEEGDGNDNDNDSPFLLEGPQTQTLDTQEELPESQEPATQKLHPKQHPRRIPYLEDTVHTVTHSEDIDLYTKEASIDIAMITKVFAKRSIRRLAVTQDVYGKRHLPVLGSTRILPNLSNAPLECDGPLATIFNQSVLSVEISQLVLEDPHPARKLSPQSPNSMRIYFYNAYADSIDEILQNYDPKQHTLLLQLQNVSSRSVLPFATHQNWDGQHFCLCIGGESTMKMGPDEEKARFDNENLQIRIAKRCNSSNGEDAFREWTLQDPKTLVESNGESLLAFKYQEWKARWGLEEQGEDVEPDSNKENESALGVTNQAPATKDVADKDVAESTTKTSDSNFDKQDATTTNRMTKERNNPVEAPNRNETQPSLEEIAASQPAAAMASESPNAKAVSTDKNNSKKQKQAQLHMQNSPSKVPKVRAAIATPAEEPTAKRSKSEFTYILISELRNFMENHRTQLPNTATGFGRVPIKKITTQCEANLFALVTGFSAPSLTKRGDWKVNVTLVDQAVMGGDDSALAVTLVIFTKDRALLPDLRRAGEVLRMHRVVVQEFNGEMQLRGQRATSYAVYRGGQVFAEDKIVSPSKYRLEDEDGDNFSALWKWGQNWLTNHATMKASEKRRLAMMRQELDNGNPREAESNLIGDFTVMITSLLPMPPALRSGITPVGFLRVWDGTGVSHSDRYAISAPAGRFFDPPSEALVAISKIRETRQGLPALPTPQRLCGRVVNVAIWEENHWTIITKGGVKIGDFVRLRNVTENFLKEIGLNCLMVGPHSWLTPLPPTTYEVLELLHDHGKRISKNHAINPTSGVLPLGESNNANTKPAPATNQEARQQKAPQNVESREERSNQPGICTTLQMLISKPCGSTFKGTVLVRATIPPIQHAGDMIKLCPDYKGSNKMSYRFALRLQDSGNTAVHAVVADPVGEQFFTMPAKSACRNGADFAFSVLSCIADEHQWDVTVKKVQVNGRTYFVLASIAPKRASTI